MVKDCLVEWSFLDEMSMICRNVASALPHADRSSSDIHTFLVVLRFVVSLCCGESGIILFSDCIRNLIVCKARWAQAIRVSQTIVVGVKHVRASSSMKLTLSLSLSLSCDV